ncbi:MAG: hypothetical protein JWL98_2151, partial [Xanthomonadaceae bacterium]|nr:hypothetical protein [Xanthomonadaceae bacterium]
NQPEVVYQGKYLRMVVSGHWEYVERVHAQGMAVIIIAVTPDDEVLFVEQNRTPLGAKTIEMPAGLVGDENADDTLQEAARRELIEETGWEAGSVEVLMTGPTSAGMSSERIAFVRATGLKRVGNGGGVGEEHIVVHAVPRRSAPSWLMQKSREGFELDLKLWAGLWMIEHDPDGSVARPG